MIIMKHDCFVALHWCLRHRAFATIMSSHPPLSWVEDRYLRFKEYFIRRF